MPPASTTPSTTDASAGTAALPVIDFTAFRTGDLPARRQVARALDRACRETGFLYLVGHGVAPELVARWTNDRFASTQHRVRNHPQHARYSLPFFFDPAFDADVSVLPCCTSEAEPPRYPATTCGAYLLQRIDESFSYHRER